MEPRKLCLNREYDDWALYQTGAVGPYGTPMIFRGTEAECDLWLDEEHPLQIKEREAIEARVDAIVARNKKEPVPSAHPRNRP